MSFGIFKIFQIFGVVSTWATQALADGKVTLAEAVDLVTQLCAILGVTPELEIPGSEPTEEEVISKASTVTPDTSKETDPTSEDRAPPGEATAPGAKLDI